MMLSLHPRLRLESDLCADSANPAFSQPSYELQISSPVLFALVLKLENQATNDATSTAARRCHSRAPKGRSRNSAEIHVQDVVKRRP